MLRATIEIMPFGDESKKRHIETIEIARTTLRNDPEDYSYWRYAENGELVATGIICGHHYREGAACLVGRAVQLFHIPRFR